MKSLNFGELVWGETPIVASLIFVRFRTFLISTHFENLIHLLLMVQNFQILDDPIEGDPQPGTLDFSRAKVLPDIFNRSSFEYSAFTFSGLKVDSMGRKRKKK